MNKKDQYFPLYIGGIKRFEVYVLNCNLCVIDLDLGYQLTKTEIIENYELKCLLLQNISAAKELLRDG